MLVTALVSLVTQATAAEPIVVQRVHLQTEAGPIRGFVARVDLTAPGVEIIATAPHADPTWPEGVHLEAELTPVDQWARRVGAALAINANYFAQPAQVPTAADIIGLSVQAQQVVSPPRIHGDRPDPALTIDQRGLARVGYFGPEELDGVQVAVAGVGSSGTAPEPGTLLVTDGQDTGSTARVQPAVRHPRTAIGTDATGRQLIIAVIDGRQPDWSIGMTLPELARLMIAHGADDAVNLDGGGSSSFYWAPPGETADAEQPVTNRPSDGHFRAVANALGVLVARPVAGDGHALSREPAEASARPGDVHAP